MLLEQFQEARELAYPAILQQLAEGVIVTDAVGTITFVNEAAAAIHGVVRLDIRPNAYADTYHLFREDGRPYPSDELPLARAVRGETVQDARWRIMRPDGRVILAIGTAQPLRAANGRRIGAVLTLRDATAQDVAEQSLRKCQAELHEVRGRLTNGAAPADDPRSLEQASRQIKGALQDMLAHTNWLLQAAAPEDIKIHGELVRSTGTALLSVIDSLLGLADAKRAVDLGSG